MAIDAFLQLFKDEAGTQQVPGECMDAVFKGAIEISEFDLDALSSVDVDAAAQKSAPTPTTPKPGEAPAVETPEEETSESFSFSIEKQFDTASTDLFLNYCAKAKGKPEPFKKAVVSLCVGGKQRKVKEDAYLQLEFTEVTVVKWEVSIGDKNIPKEEVEFYFESYVMRYKKQMHDGTFKAMAPLGFDFNTGKKK